MMIMTTCGDANCRPHVDVNERMQSLHPLAATLNDVNVEVQS